MTDTPKVPKGGSAFFKRKVFGVPMLYIVGGFVAILAVLAWRMKPSANLTTQDQQAATDAGTDAANPSGSTLEPTMPSGTVVAAPAQPTVEDAPYEDNSTWLRKGVAFLISKGQNPGNAQLALQHYLAGSNLSYAEGQLRDMVVREYGLPPDGFDAGTTAPKPAPVTTPAPVPTPPKPAPKPAPKPVPKPPTTSRNVYYVVRRGDSLSAIAARYHSPGGWQGLYAKNRAVIGSNPNLIKPGQRLLVRW